MSVVTKQSSIPVATRAITLLTATLPAQCEKLSTPKPDSVHRRQTVLHTSSGSIRWYQSDKWLYQLWLTANCSMWMEKTVRVCAHQHVIFRGTPDDSAPWNRAYPEPLALNSALLGHHLQSGDRGCVSAPPQMWQQWEFLGLCDVISASYAVCRMGWLYMCVYVCLERQTGCDDKLQGGFHGRKKNQNW